MHPKQFFENLTIKVMETSMNVTLEDAVLG